MTKEKKRKIEILKVSQIHNADIITFVAKVDGKEIEDRCSFEAISKVKNHPNSDIYQKVINFIKTKNQNSKGESDEKTSVNK